MITVNSFFSGIGGFDLGFEKMGFEVKYQCEINTFCINILRKHWPNIQLDQDISKVVPKKIPKADIWCGGFPCQDVSVARGAMGRDGLKGKNSGLFYEFFRLIKERKPEIILLENVTGLLNSHNGSDFKVVLQSLTSIGYGVSWRVFNTKYYGTPQSRPRVYICAWKGSVEKAMFALHEYEASVKPENLRKGFLRSQNKPGHNATVPEIAYCLAATSGRHTGTDWSRTYISYYQRVRRLTPNEAEKLQGFPAGWTIPNTFQGKATLDLDSFRYHAAGNAVSVPVVVWIANRIKQIKEKKIINRGILPAIKKFADFPEDRIRTQYFSELNSKSLFQDEKTPKIKWNSGGIALGDKVVDCHVYHCPTLPFSTSLIDIIDDDPVDNKYYISSSAAKGILRRVNSQERIIFSPLKSALERLAQLHTEKVEKTLEE